MPDTQSPVFLIIIPTYNEIGNIEPFIKKVFDYTPEYGNILVVDDNSPDGTAAAVEKMIPRYPERLHILNRTEKQGLAAAYLAGFAWGISRHYDIFLEMDADFSHNPAYIPLMLEKVQNHDVVIGSRNVADGGVEGWPFLRTVVSKGGSMYSRIVLGCPIRDLTGGFNMWRKPALEKINLDAIISKGYSFQIEMKYRAYRAGCAIVEIPIVFVDRKEGKSKMSKRIFFEALINVWQIKGIAKKTSLLSVFIKFALTGGLGTVTNLLLFFIFADLLNIPEIPVSIGCFLIAVTQNYLINHRWSFGYYTANKRPSVKKWLEFTAGSLAGLAVNVFVMRAVLVHFLLPYKFIAQGLGIAAGMIINFAIANFIIFKKERTRIK
jgi:dolichol-phosphate mannosyltransferase